MACGFASKNLYNHNQMLFMENLLHLHLIQRFFHGAKLILYSVCCNHPYIFFIKMVISFSKV